MADRVTPQVRSKIMSRIRSKDTKPEIMLRRALYSKGIRYRKHVNSLPGKPDLVIQNRKIAIFVDGDFWHGMNWENLQKRLVGSYWLDKIRKNIERDIIVNHTLESQDWVVLRYWESNIKSNLGKVTDEIVSTISERSHRRESERNTL